MGVEYGIFFLDNLSCVFFFFFFLRDRFSTEVQRGPNGAMFSPCTSLNNKQHYLSACLPSVFQPFTLTCYLMVINPSE